MFGFHVARRRLVLPLAHGQPSTHLRRSVTAERQFPYEVKGYGVRYVKTGDQGVFQPQIMVARFATFTRMCRYYPARKVVMIEGVTRHEIREGILNFVASNFAMNQALGGDPISK